MPKVRGVGEVILNVPKYSKILLYGAGSQLKENIKAMTIQVSLYVPFGFLVVFCCLEIFFAEGFELLVQAH